MSKDIQEYYCKVRNTHKDSVFALFLKLTNGALIVLGFGRFIHQIVVNSISFRPLETTFRSPPIRFHFFSLGPRTHTHTQTRQSVFVFCLREHHRWHLRQVYLLTRPRYNAGCYIIKAVSCGIKDLDSAIPVALDEETPPLRPCPRRIESI